MNVFRSASTANFHHNSRKNETLLVFTILNVVFEDSSIPGRMAEGHRNIIKENRKMKTNRIIIGALFIFFMMYGALLQAASANYQLIATDELKKMLDEGESVTVVDARNPEEYQEVHIKGAVNIPEKKFAEHLDKLPADKSTKIIFYCNGVKCGKSKKAAKKAMESGYGNLYVYAEGMPVWEEKGMPIYTGPDYEKRIETTIIIPAELNDLLKNGTATYTVVDVRDEEEFAEGHIPGAINIPVASFASRSDVLDKKKKIIVYCNSGGRSYNAYRKLMKLSYKDINQAIFADWKEAGLPVRQL